MIKYHMCVLITHITTDLVRIAYIIVFIHKVKIVFQKSMEYIREQFHHIKGPKNLLDKDTRKMFHGIEEKNDQFTALLEGDAAIFETVDETVVIERASLEDIMYYLTRK